MTRPLKKSILLTVLCLNFVACSSATKRFDQQISQGACDEAAQSIPEQKDLGIRLLSQTQEAGGTLASYAFTGAGYTAQVLWDVAGGTVMFVALCSPLIAGQLSVSIDTTRPSDSSRLVCFPGKLSALSAPPLGQKAFEASKPLRCPNVSPLSRSIRRVAGCYQNQGTPAAFEKAEKSLKALQASGEFYECLSKEEQSALDRQMEEIAQRSGKALL